MITEAATWIKKESSSYFSSQFLFNAQNKHLAPTEQTSDHYPTQSFTD